MNKFIILALILASCTKEAILEPIKTPGKIETRDYIDQNFFDTPPKIDVQYCKDGTYCLNAINPMPTGGFETYYTYEWEFIRCDGCGVDTSTEMNIKVNVLSGTSVVLKVVGYRLGSNIKSDKYYASIKIN